MAGQTAAGKSSAEFALAGKKGSGNPERKNRNPDKLPERPPLPSGLELLRGLVPLAVLIGLQYIDLEGLGLKRVVQTIFMWSNGVVLAIMTYIYHKIKKVSKEEKIDCPAVMKFGFEMEPAETKTHYEYEMSEFRLRMKEVLIVFWLTLWAYYKFETASIMATQGVMTITGTYDSLFKVHVLGTESRSYDEKAKQ